MALNVPAGNVKNVTFGPGILYITSPVNYTLGTPNVDIGYCRGAQFQVTRGRLDLFQGSPKSYISTFAVQEDVTLQMVGLEWNLTNLNYALGAGVITGTAPTTDYAFGGTLAFTEVALLFRHRTPSLGTVDIYIWRAQGQGENTFAFGDDFQEFTFNFKALESLSTWTNNALPIGGSLFRMRYQQGP
jgi:hypothetical protein